MYTPVHRETMIGTVSFAGRFWDDGSPRLTAYEYQGILDSACFRNGQPGNRINCLSCHTMHDGDIQGQITEDKRTNNACTQCHTDLREQNALAQHTKHEPGSTGSSCYACHMPEVVYGIQTFHKTHKITVPDPQLTIDKNVPNACNQCHVDKSVNWTIDQAKTLWPNRYKVLDASPDPQFQIAESIRGLFAGDALTRAMMADALTKHADLNWAEPFLIESFGDDNYPIVRYFTANGLLATHVSIAKPDYLADANVRAQQIAKWMESLSPDKLAQAKALAISLRAKRKDTDLEVGE
jgi:predicted CXXCH cytochrome family protein